MATLSRLPVRVLVMTHDQVWSWRLDPDNEITAPGLSLPGVDPNAPASGNLPPGDLAITGRTSGGQALANTTAERLALAVLHGDTQAIALLRKQLDEEDAPLPPRKKASLSTRRKLRYARVQIDEPGGKRQILHLHDVKLRIGQTSRHALDEIHLQGMATQAGRETTSPAEQLALAVLHGDKEAALPLADEVQLGWLEQTREARA